MRTTRGGSIVNRKILALLDKIINYPANENSDPDVMGSAINSMQELAEEIKQLLTKEKGPRP